MYIPYLRSSCLPKLTASTARQNFSDIVNRAAYGGERIIVHRRQKPVAAVVSIEDLELIERIEDEVDAKDALKALKEPGTIPWETVKKKLRL
jgi:prevent-host-death family protein